MLCQYILVRSDVGSLKNPGMMAAQSCHAANLMVEHLRARQRNEGLDNDLREWQSQANGYGTCIVLSVPDLSSLEEIINNALDSFVAGKVTDPTYPLRDGLVIHTFPLVTCGYVFGDSLELQPYLGHLPLAGAI